MSNLRQKLSSLNKTSASDVYKHALNSFISTLIDGYAKEAAKEIGFPYTEEVADLVFKEIDVLDTDLLLTVDDKVKAAVKEWKKEAKKDKK